VSNAHLSDNSTIVVYVETVANARVMTSAHYKITTNTEPAKANGYGLAVTSYDVSDATEGFRVIATVTVQRAAGALPGTPTRRSAPTSS
jgi:hypothetical protein